MYEDWKISLNRTLQGYYITTIVPLEDENYIRKRDRYVQKTWLQT